MCPFFFIFFLLFNYRLIITLLFLELNFVLLKSLSFMLEFSCWITSLLKIKKFRLYLINIVLHAINIIKPLIPIYSVPYFQNNLNNSVVYGLNIGSCVNFSSLHTSENKSFIKFLSSTNISRHCCQHM